MLDDHRSTNSGSSQAATLPEVARDQSDQASVAFHVAAASGVNGASQDGTGSNISGGARSSYGASLLQSESSTSSSICSLLEPTASHELYELGQLADSFRFQLAKLRRLVESLASEVPISESVTSSVSTEPDDPHGQASRSQLQEQLGQALRVLRALFERHPALQCPPLLLAAGDMIQAVKTATGHSKSTFDGQLMHAIDKLAVLFGNR